MSYFKTKMYQIDFGWGSAPDPACKIMRGNVFVPSPDHLAGFKGAYF